MNEGWGFIYNSKKWHYYVNGHSLCGRWMVIVGQQFEQGNDNSPDNCAACRKKLAVRQALQGVGSQAENTVESAGST